MEMSGRADLDNLVLATVLALGVPLEDKRYRLQVAGSSYLIPLSALLNHHPNNISTNFLVDTSSRSFKDTFQRKPPTAPIPPKTTSTLHPKLNTP
jgi:hypothetical protein